MRPAWVGKASTAVSTSKAPDVKLCSGRGVDALDPQNSGSEEAKLTYSLDTLNLCGAWPFRLLKEPRTQEQGSSHMLPHLNE